MKIFPAVDLRGGNVVRLLKGDYDKMTVYSDDPLEVAEKFEDQGAEYIHVVDLDGARDGSQPNFTAVTEIIDGTDLKVEIGGGVRSEEIITDYARAGALRVIIGTMAIKDPEFTARMIRQYRSSIAVGVDISGIMVAIDGWTNVTRITVDDMFESLIEDGCRTVICTDISKDGAMEGTNLELYRNLVRDYGGYMDIIASGGISTMKDLEKLADLGIDGAIIGKALYTGALDLGEAIKEFQN